MANMETQDSSILNSNEALLNQDNVDNSAELKVVMMAQQGDELALQALIEIHSHTVFDHVKAYIHRPYYEIERDQLVAVGNEKLYEAIFQFGPEQQENQDFSTFASRYIQKGLRAYVANSKQDILQQLEAETDLLHAETQAHKEPSVSALALEQQVILKAQAGDPRAEQALIEQYSKLIFSQVRQYANRPFYWEEQEDLEQVARETLFKAIKLYRSENEEGAKFSTYVTKCIRNELKSYVASLGFFKKSRQKYRDGCEANRLSQEGKTLEEIAAIQNVATYDVVSHLNTMSGVSKLESQVGTDDNIQTWHDIIADESSHDPEDQAIKDQEAESLKSWISELAGPQEQAMQLHLKGFSFDRNASIMTNLDGMGKAKWNKEGARQEMQKAIQKITYFKNRDEAKQRESAYLRQASEHLSTQGMFGQQPKEQVEKCEPSVKNTPKRPSQA